MMGTCTAIRQPNDYVFRRIVYASGASLEETQTTLLNHCTHDAQPGDQILKLVRCADGYYATAWTFGFCGATTVSAAILGLVKQYPTSATPEDKARGLNWILGHDLAIGTFSSTQIKTIHCEYIGANSKGQLQPRFRGGEHGTASSYCQVWDWSRNIGEPSIDGDEQTFPLITSFVKQKQ